MAFSYFVDNEDEEIALAGLLPKIFSSSPVDEPTNYSLFQ